tara:strand:- start:1345 stop:2154 length:810 start_codon:yes stop_codon:yes gene_type:complete
MEREINKFHALQLFTDTFSAETVHLTNEAVGIYIRLLCFAWTKNTKPFTSESAYRICQCINDDCKKKVDDILEEFFTIEIEIKFSQSEDVNCWTHKRLVQEHQYLTDKYKKRSMAGKKGASIRHSANGKTLTPIPNPNPNPNNKYIYSDTFEQLWSLLKIKRGSKFKAHQEFSKVDGIIGLGIEEIAKIYNAQQKDIEDKFVPHFSTWLYQRRWENDEKREQSITIVQKMEKLGYVFRHTESNFDYFKKDGIEYKIDKYDKNHIIHKVE